ncbi:MAG: pyruvate synthase subunit beta [Actinobacteria bacterium]|nr:pyruvate synthase subunit beta [Actinomycetota bacterium]MBU4386691.1 pyruvate synthase subunit beta [Actinomycetota bacterium]MBU4490442.1 pyruvate synthase subunit beta [Actinomycetota bacterium]MCG2796358.1 pyruvate synthase subunit beta [Actinomycetes bacterium]
MTEQTGRAKFLPRHLPSRELFAEGHRGCQGCGEALALRQLLEVAGPDTIVCSCTGCVEIISSPYPETAWRVPWIHVAFENAAAVAAGVEAGIKILRKKGRYPADRRINVIALAGDGGTADIGFQALSGALERWHDFTYICTDNEAYMNTGIQRSSSTPYGASTTTSPAGKISIGQQTQKKDMPMIVAAHDIPYVATCCPSYPLDLIKKARRAFETIGPTYLHVFCPCPVGWRHPSDMSVEIGRLAVKAGVFPLFEIADGKLKLNRKMDKRKPVVEYLETQGRFSHLKPEDVEEIQRRVDENYQRLVHRAECDAGGIDRSRH